MYYALEALIAGLLDSKIYTKLKRRTLASIKEEHILYILPFCLNY